MDIKYRLILIMGFIIFAITANCQKFVFPNYDYLKINHSYFKNTNALNDRFILVINITKLPFTKEAPLHEDIFRNASALFNSLGLTVVSCAYTDQLCGTKTKETILREILDNAITGIIFITINSSFQDNKETVNYSLSLTVFNKNESMIDENQDAYMITGNSWDYIAKDFSNKITKTYLKITPVNNNIHLLKLTNPGKLNIKTKLPLDFSHTTLYIPIAERIKLPNEPKKVKNKTALAGDQLYNSQIDTINASIKRNFVNYPYFFKIIKPSTELDYLRNDTITKKYVLLSFSSNYIQKRLEPTSNTEITENVSILKYYILELSGNNVYMFNYIPQEQANSGQIDPLKEFISQLKSN